MKRLIIATKLPNKFYHCSDIKFNVGDVIHGRFHKIDSDIIKKYAEQLPEIEDVSRMLYTTDYHTVEEYRSDYAYCYEVQPDVVYAGSCDYSIIALQADLKNLLAATRLNRKNLIELFASAYSGDAKALRILKEFGAYHVGISEYVCNNAVVVNVLQ